MEEAALTAETLKDGRDVPLGLFFLGGILTRKARANLLLLYYIGKTPLRLGASHARTMDSSSKLLADESGCPLTLVNVCKKH